MSLSGHGNRGPQLAPQGQKATLSTERTLSTTPGLKCNPMVENASLIRLRESVFIFFPVKLKSCISAAILVTNFFAPPLATQLRRWRPQQRPAPWRLSSRRSPWRRHLPPPSRPPSPAALRFSLCGGASWCRRCGHAMSPSRPRAASSPLSTAGCMRAWRNWDL